MRILTGGKWRGGYLDYHRNTAGYRVQVLRFKNLEELKDVYHTRAKSLRLLLNYFPVVGFEGLVTKTWSRLREEKRNEKYVSCGVGKVLQRPDNGRFQEGNIVGFIAPLHPACPERIVLPEELLFSAGGGSAFGGKTDATPELLEGVISYIPLSPSTSSGNNGTWWKDVRAWSVYSGEKISEELRSRLAEHLKKEITNTDWLKAQNLDVKKPSAVAEIKSSPSTSSGNKKQGILFGFGNYAKINIIPYMKPFVDIRSVHEADPTQISEGGRVQTWDTCPFPKTDEKADVFFVASYNHTHTPITLHALRQGAYAVVEKPIVMDYEELDELEKVLRTAGRKFFVGFHKRYGLFNKFAREDLGVKPGEPISYHSIVYELIQPKFFWYNWPVSRSTFFANGCHQIDHFLHLNNFSKPKDFDIKLLQDGAIDVWIELENGAVFTTTFSEKGVSRVGPRDFVELKVPNRNVRITDAIQYQSEDNHRIIRKKRIFKTNSYKDMYRTIGKTIAENGEGDTIQSILISAKLMLDLEEKLQALKGWGDRYKLAKQNFYDAF
ncbi:MAG: Gfo/Idh/MocA family oxidoreductase [bacterium]|nr:Gfo/Idh/MocA family oxidoreductase [bacterium]